MILNVELSPKQGDAFLRLNDKVTEELLFGGAANGGKSWLGCFWLVSMCCQYPETKYYIGREELKRLRDSTFITFWKVCKKYEVSDYFKYNGQDHYIQHKNGSRIDLLDLKYLPSDPLYERYGSSEYTSGWVEEGGEVHFDAYDTLKSRIGRQLNDKYGILAKQLITSNPKKNWLYRLFYKPDHEGTLPPNRAFIQSLVTDNIFREAGAKERLESIENEAKRQRLLYGNWEYEDEPDQLIHFEWVEKCKTVEFVDGKKSFGGDVARYGDDWSARSIMQGNKLLKIESKYGMSIPKTSEWMRQAVYENRIDADRVGVDGVGMGAGVVDIMRETYKLQVRDIQSGGKAPFSEMGRFNNLRSYMWWLAREDIRTGKVLLSEASEKLVEDLTAPKYEYRNDKMICVESKEKIKLRLGRSTDEGDSFVYNNYMRHLNKTDITSKTINTLRNLR